MPYLCDKLKKTTKMDVLKKNTMWIAIAALALAAYAYHKMTQIDSRMVLDENNKWKFAGFTGKVSTRNPIA